MRTVILSAALLSATVAAGAEPKAKPKPKGVVLSGVISLDGKPIDASLTFHPAKDNTVVPYQSKVGADGKYTSDPLPPGEYIATLTKIVASDDPKGPRTKNLVPSKYADPRMSDLKVTVEDGKTKFDIEMKSK